MRILWFCKVPRIKFEQCYLNFKKFPRLGYRSLDILRLLLFYFTSTVKFIPFLRQIFINRRNYKFHMFYGIANAAYNFWQNIEVNWHFRHVVLSKSMCHFSRSHNGVTKFHRQSQLVCWIMFRLCSACRRFIII